MELDWSALLLIFFCLMMVALASGMPVAIGFLTLNILGLYFFSNYKNSSVTYI